MSEKKPCNFCSRPGILRQKKSEELEQDLYVCNGCQSLLKNPVTGIPFLRSYLESELRSIEPKTRKKMISNFIKEISKWKPTQ